MLCVFNDKPLLPFQLVDFAVGSDGECGHLLVELAGVEALQLTGTQGSSAEHAVLKQSAVKQGLSARWPGSPDSIVVPLSNQQECQMSLTSLAL